MLLLEAFLKAERPSEMAGLAEYTGSVVSRSWPLTRIQVCAPARRRVGANTLYGVAWARVVNAACAARRCLI